MVHNVLIGGQTTGDNYTEGFNDEPVAGSEGLVCVVSEEYRHETDTDIDNERSGFLSCKEKTPIWADDLDRNASGRLVERWNGDCCAKNHTRKPPIYDR